MTRPLTLQLLRQRPVKPLLLQTGAGAVVIPEVIFVEEEAAAEPLEADKIIIPIKIAKIKPNLKTINQSLTRKVPDMLMGPQTVPAPATGPQVAVRPTVPTP